ncbi:MAG: hypothetical protein CMO07_12850 [Thalassospira sp.]|uniref:nucleotidyltransferase family protein n=1 Tax=Thalassospira sp. UBA4513 TaxID=1947675 RepID=UPI000C43F8C6|nr:nucleotidyltransferase family protein [Thalassospira sp. UBA4513]MBE71575.1 hypothetical protein [Thalassospira sp.]|tara:strand:+ start:297 stop:923 length:627 start_codon:yes stop_codon:yes gene_type:complete
MSAGQRANDIPLGCEFLEGILQNRTNQIILDRFSAFGIKDWWLTAGCLAQTIWNITANHAPGSEIADYDLFYFDPDTSWQAEDHVIAQGAKLFADIPVSIEIRNQARVPIWYPEKFGVPYGTVTAASDGIDRFAYQTTAIGVRKDAGNSGMDAYRIYAPFGLAAVMEGRVIPNTVLPVKEVYDTKVGRWQKTWPDLVVTPWPDEEGQA